MKTNNKAFTLTELLVVLVIIAVLAGFIFPIYKNVVTSSKQTKSLNNIRLVGQGLLNWIYQGNGGRLPYAYINKNGTYPDGFDVNTLPVHYTYWAGTVFHGGYIESVDVFFSPLQKTYWKDSTFQTALRKSADAWQWAMIAYGANGMYMPYSTDAKGQPTLSIASVERPAQSALLTEAAPNPAQSSNGKYDGFHAVLPGRMTYPLAVRTSGKVATFFMDGHAGILKPAELGWDEKEKKWENNIDRAQYPWGG